MARNKQRESTAIIEAMDPFTHMYLITALWAGVEPPDGHPLADKLYDLLPESVDADTLRQMIKDCERFLTEARPIIKAAAETGEVEYGPDCGDEIERAGHDFWMTRCGHGVGFWDGGWPKPYGDQLTKIAKKYGEVDLYVGDDGRVYSM